MAAHSFFPVQIQTKLPPTVISAWEVEPIRLIDAVTNDLLFIISHYPSIEAQIQVNAVSLVQKVRKKLNSVATNLMDTRILQMASDASNADIDNAKKFASLHIEYLQRAFASAKLKHWFTTHSSWEQVRDMIMRQMYSL